MRDKAEEVEEEGSCTLVDDLKWNLCCQSEKQEGGLRFKWAFHLEYKEWDCILYKEYKE